MTTDRIILEISLYTYGVVIIALVVTIFSSYKRQSPDFRWLAYFVGFSLACDVFALTLYYSTGLNPNTRARFTSSSQPHC